MTLEASLVIPTYNKKEFLELTLASLMSQTYPYEKFEIVIVDDGSTDGTHELFSSSTHFPFRYVYVKQENAGRAAARNTGILRAQGETIIFLDDDQIVPSQFVEKTSKVTSAKTEFSRWWISFGCFFFFTRMPRSIGRFFSICRNCFQTKKKLSNLQTGRSTHCSRRYPF